MDAVRYSFSRLDASSAAGFESLTYARLRPPLASLGRDPALIAIGARFDARPVGLVLAEIGFPDAASVSLLSIATADDHRRRGIAMRLLEGIEAAARAASCSRVRAVRPDNLDAAVALFRKAGWSAPVPERLIARAWVDRFASAPWTLRWYPDGYELFPWRELTATDQRELARLEAGAAFPEYLHPLQGGARVDADASTGLRFGGQLVGWFICHAYSDDTRLVNSLFAVRETAVHGRAAPLLGRSLRRLRGTPVRKLVWEVHASNQAMTRFTMKRLAPWSYSVRRASSVSKDL